MEKKSSVYIAKRNLETSLGDDWQKYLSHLRKFFRNGNKQEFDKEIRGKKLFSLQEVP